MKKRFFYAGLLLILVLYYFLITPSTGKELIFKPLAVALADKIQTGTGGIEPVAIETLNFAGFIDSGLSATNFSPKKFRVSLDDSRMILYDKRMSERTIISSNGDITGKFEARGYPIITGGHIFVYDAVINTLEERDFTGRRIWIRNTPSSITALTSGGDNIVIGLLDGRCLLLDKSGNEYFSFQPGGSRIEAIYGATLSHDGTKMAVLSGLDPQRVIILEKRDTGFRPLDHLEPGEEYKRSVLFHFSDDDKRVYWQGYDLIRYYEFKTRKFGALPIKPGSYMTVMHQDPEESKLFMITILNQKSTLTVRDDKDCIIFSGAFPSNFSNLRYSDSHLFIVSDDRILLVRLEEG